MKLINSAILAVVLSIVWVQAGAQDNFDDRMNYIFQHVDKSQVNTGYLKDYGFEFLNPDNYTGSSLHDSNYVGLKDWRMLYATLLSCRVNSQASAPGFDVVNNQINTYNYGNMPLTFVSMDFDYNRLKADALNSSLMYVSNDQLYDVPGRPVSPYETASMFAIAPTHQQVLQGNNQIIFRPELFYSNNGKTVANIAYNIGGGNSYTSIGFNTPASVTFANTGWYSMNIRVTYTDNTTRYGHTKVLVFSNPAYGQSQARYDNSRAFLELNRVVPATEAYQGVTGAVQMTVQLSVNNTTGAIRRPLIIVEGYDPNNDIGFDLTTGSMLVNASGYSNTLNDQLDAIESYDLVFVNYINSMDFIQRNALAVEEVIKWVNSHKTTFNGVRQGNVIIGQSMGGLVTRWALRDMELDGVAHETRLFVSHDSPHWGANVPASAQLGVQYLSTWHVINGFNFPFFTYGQMFPQINDAMNMFNSPAARQMLIKRYVLNGNSYSEENSLHDAFMNELNGMGWPVNSRNVLVSNGACNGTKAFADNSNLVTLGGTSGNLSWLQTIGTGFLSAIFGSINSGGVLTGYGNPQFNSWSLIMDFPLSLITTQKTYTMDFRLNAVPSTGTGELFRAQIYNDKKILWVINARSYILNKVYNSFSGMWPLDNAPGGQYDIENGGVDVNLITDGLPGFLDFIQPALNHPRFCFVPTVSALAFNDPLSNLTASFCNNIPCLQTSSVADYFAPTANEEHIAFTANNSGWLLQRQNPSFNCAKICPTGLSISGSGPVCTSSIFTLNNVPAGTTVNWTTDAQWLPLTPAGASVTVTRPTDAEGEFTLTAQVSNACNSVPAITTPSYQVGTPGVFEGPIFTNAVGGMGYFCSSHTGNTMQLPEIQGIQYRYRIRNYPQFNIVYTNPQTYTGNVITIPYTPQAGWYIVEIQAINSCGNHDWEGFEVEYVDCNTGGGGDEMRIAVSPNPASSNLFVTLDDRQIAQTEKIECTLYNLLGSKIAKRWVLSAGQSRYQLNVAGIQPGQYVLVFQQGAKSITKKVMIK